MDRLEMISHFKILFAYRNVIYDIFMTSLSIVNFYAI